MKLYPYTTADIVIYQNQQLSIRKHWFGFFCTNCFKPHIVQMSYDFTSTLDDIEDEIPSPSVQFVPKFYYQCPICKRHNEWEGFLDPNITPMLAELNRKGYETQFSCEGHSVNESSYDPKNKIWQIIDDCYSCPYILFKNPDLKEVCRYVPLLGHWQLDNFDEGFYISVNEKHRDKNENLSYLKRWVDCLPYLYNGEFHPDLITGPIKQKIELAQQPLTDTELKPIIIRS